MLDMSAGQGSATAVAMYKDLGLAPMFQTSEAVRARLIGANAVKAPLVKAEVASWAAAPAASSAGPAAAAVAASTAPQNDFLDLFDDLDAEPERKVDQDLTDEGGQAASAPAGVTWYCAVTRTGGQLEIYRVPDFVRCFSCPEFSLGVCVCGGGAAL